MGTTVVRIRLHTVVWGLAAMLIGASATWIVNSAWRADAAPGDLDSTFVPISGCRAFDLRPAPDTVGPRLAPLFPEETYTQQITGGIGECIGELTIPNNAVAVAMNVTAVNPTAQTNLRFFPADVNDVPLVSNLNVSAGQAPFPNKVDVELSPTGAIKMFNQSGTVSVVGDVVGYYTNDTLTDIDTRLINLAERASDAEALLAANDAAAAQNSISLSELLDSVPFAQESGAGSRPVLGEVSIVTLDLAAPVDGDFTVVSAATATLGPPGQGVLCSISTTSSLDGDYLLLWESGGDESGARGSMSGTRVIPVAAGSNTRVAVVCSKPLGLGESATVIARISAIFTPAP